MSFRGSKTAETTGVRSNLLEAYLKATPLSVGEKDPTETDTYLAASSR